MNRKRMAIVASSILVLALLARCTGGDDVLEPTAGGGDVTSYISGVSSPGGNVVLRTGVPPQPGGGPSIQALGNTTVINGGSNLIGVTASAPLSRVVVSVQGVSGWYEVGVPTDATNLQILLTFPQSMPSTSFQCVYAGGNAEGVGPQVTVPTSVTTVGTGDVQVSLSWTKLSDLDLHVVPPPGGLEIYYANRSYAGGTLDLDSNAACEIDGVNNENVTFPTGQAPRGTYTVRVDNWDSCGQEPIPYTVVVHRASRAPISFSGTFHDPGDNGAAGAGTTITTFTF